MPTNRIDLRSMNIFLENCLVMVWKRIGKVSLFNICIPIYLKKKHLKNKKMYLFNRDKKNIIYILYLTKLKLYKQRYFWLVIIQIFKVFKYVCIKYKTFKILVKLLVLEQYNMPDFCKNNYMKPKFMLLATSIADIYWVMFGHHKRETIQYVL